MICGSSLIQEYVVFPRRGSDLAHFIQNTKSHQILAESTQAMVLGQFGTISSEIISISSFRTHFVDVREIKFIYKTNGKVKKT